MAVCKPALGHFLLATGPITIPSLSIALPADEVLARERAGAMALTLYRAGYTHFTLYADDLWVANLHVSAPALTVVDTIR